MVELWTHLADRKGGAGNPPPTGARASALPDGDFRGRERRARRAGRSASRSFGCCWRASISGTVTRSSGTGRSP